MSESFSAEVRLALELANVIAALKRHDERLNEIETQIRNARLESEASLMMDEDGHFCMGCGESSCTNPSHEQFWA